MCLIYRNSVFIVCFINGIGTCTRRPCRTRHHRVPPHSGQNLSVRFFCMSKRCRDCERSLTEGGRAELQTFGPWKSKHTNPERRRSGLTGTPIVNVGAGRYYESMEEAERDTFYQSDHLLDQEDEETLA